MDQLVAIDRGELGDSLFTASVPSLVDNLLECVNIHGFTFSTEHSLRAYLPETGGRHEALLHCRAVVGQLLFVHCEHLVPFIVETAVLNFLDTDIQPLRLLGEMSTLRPAYV